MSVWPGVVAGIASGVVGGGLNLVANAATNQASTDIANRNNATAIELANTQYSRSKADMQRAGLNPALMYGSAGPAPVPPLQAPALRAPDFSGPARQVGDAVSTGIALKQAQQGIDNNYLVQLEQIAKIKAEIANLPSSTGMLELQKQLTKAQTRLAEFNAQPNSLNEVGAKLLNRFLGHLEDTYNKYPSARRKWSYGLDLGVSDMIDGIDKSLNRLHGYPQQSGASGGW